MKKKILFLGLIMIMALTSCGIKDKDKEALEVTGKAEALTDEEFAKLEKYVDEYNKPLEGKVKATADQKEREVNIEVGTSTTISDPELLRETTTELSKLIFKNVAKEVEVNYYYEGEKDDLLMLVKDGEIKEDNFDKYLEEHPEKKGDNSEISAQQKTIMEKFITEANAENSDTLRVEFEEESKTVFIILSDGTQITDKAAIKDTAKKTSADIKDIIGEGYTISVVYDNKKDSPVISYKDEEVITDNLK